MKKLFILLAAVALTAMSANVFAQSTGTTPAPGATHQYTITPGAAGNTIEWSVTKGDLNTDASTDAIISASNAATTNIEWAVGLTPGDWYYVHVLETDGAGCSNEKVLPVQITTSPFYLTLAATNATQCYDNVVTVSLADVSTINYDHGTATLVFTVTPNGLSTSYTGYEFDLAIVVPDGFTPTPAFSTNASLTGSTVTVTDNNAVTITYTVDNTNVYTNASAIDAQNFTATVTISNGETINGVDDNADGIYTDKTDVARPNTSGISTN